MVCFCINAVRMREDEASHRPAELFTLGSVR